MRKSCCFLIVSVKRGGMKQCTRVITTTNKKRKKYLIQSAHSCSVSLRLHLGGLQDAWHMTDSNTPTRYGKGSYFSRLLKEEAHRMKQAKRNAGFTLRDSFTGPTLEFPGVDIDRIHYLRGMKKAA